MSDERSSWGSSSFAELNRFFRASGQAASRMIRMETGVGSNEGADAEKLEVDVVHTDEHMLSFVNMHQFISLLALSRRADRAFSEDSEIFIGEHDCCSAERNVLTDISEAMV